MYILVCGVMEVNLVGSKCVGIGGMVMWWCVVFGFDVGV